MNREYIIALAEQLAIFRKALLDNGMELDAAREICVAYMSICFDYVAKGV